MWTCMWRNTAGHLGQRNKSSSVVSIPLCFWPLGSNTVFTADGLHAPHCSLLTQVPLLPPCYLQLTHTPVTTPTDRAKSWRVPISPGHTSVQLGKLLHNLLEFLSIPSSLLQMLMWALCGCTAKVDLSSKYGKTYVSLLKTNHAYLLVDRMQLHNLQLS